MRLIGAGLILLFGVSAHTGELIKLRLNKAKSSVDIVSVNLSVVSKSSASESWPDIGAATVSLVGKGAASTWVVKERDSDKVRKFSGNKLVVKGDRVRLNSRLVPSSLEFIARSDGRFDVMAYLDLERYLEGVLPSEMPASWPLEALKAQAVASRSYAMRLRRDRAALRYHLESTIFDQVYQLSNHQSASKAIKKKIHQAIEETKGLYLRGHDKQPIRAYYHADCGGETEEPFRVWSNSEVNGTVKDPSCPLSPLGRWSVKMTREQVHQAFYAHFKVSEEAILRQVRPTKRSPSGRVLEVEFDYWPGGRLQIDSNNFRRLLGFARIKSTKFEIKWSEKAVKIEGEGHGHGVGMCQYGARMLARRGLDYRSILKHYYSKADLVERWEKPIISGPQIKPTKTRTTKKATAKAANKFM